MMDYTKDTKIAKVGNEKGPGKVRGRLRFERLGVLCDLGVNTQAVAGAAARARLARLIIECMVAVGLAPFETQ